MLIQSDYGLELGLVNAFFRANDTQTLFFLFVLWDGLLDWRMVLLVAGEDVSDERALTWQEAARYFERFAVPEFTLRLDVDGVEGQFFF